MNTFSFLCLFGLVLILALLSGDVSGALVKERLTAKTKELAKDKT